jgi:hypothetical protein
MELEVDGDELDACPDLNWRRRKPMGRSCMSFPRPELEEAEVDGEELRVRRSI